MPFTRKQTSAIRSAAAAIGRGRRRMRGISTLQARFRGTRVRRMAPRVRNIKRVYLGNKSMASRLNNIGETKLLGLNPYNNIPGAAGHGGSAIRATCFVLDKEVPNNWDDNLNALGGIEIVKGDTAQNRDGNYIYLKKSVLQLQIDMPAPSNDSPDASPPSEFRVLVLKQRRGFMRPGLVLNPGETMFLDVIGQKTGYRSANMRPIDVMTAPVNKRDFTVMREQKFVLSKPTPAAINAGRGYSGHYPCYKRLNINLPHYKKTHYDGSNLPDNYNYVYMVYVFARGIDDNTPALYDITTRGNTQFMDV